MSITEPAQMRLAAEAGLQLIPLHRWDATSTDRAGKPRQDGKRPLDMDWPRRPYSNDEVLARAERNGLNVGVRLTAELLVVDVDPRNMPQGRHTLAELSSVIGADLSDWLPRTETGSGGLHLWMTKPADVAVVDSLSDFPGVEFKTRGRQVVAPGSIHPNGQPYRLNDPLEDLRAPDPIPPALLDLIARKPSRYSAGDDAGDAQLDPEDVEAVLAAMGEVPDYDDWLKVLMACHAVSAGVALAECQEWSYEGDAELVADKWRRFGPKGNGAGRVGWGTLKRLAKQYGGDKAEMVCDRIERGDPGDDFMDDVEPEAPGKPLAESSAEPEVGGPLPDDQPMTVARGLLKGQPLIRSNGDWLRYDPSLNCYVEMPAETFRSRAWNWSEGRPYVSKGSVKRLVANNTMIANIEAAAIAQRQGPRDLPAWLRATDGVPPPSDLLPVRNGLLHLPTMNLLPPTSSFVSQSASPVEFDAFADDPVRWIRFLASVMGDDQEAIDTLQEVIGYLLTQDTSQQKIFCLVGPPRSGKGTINQIAQKLIGEGNYTSPTANDLGKGTFGLQRLIGRQLATISDMRMGRSSDPASLAENLLRISGEDEVSVDRKYRDAWEGRLSTRFLLVSNETPQFRDTSGAIVSRMILMRTRESFLGKEDPGLQRSLSQELPGILNWALEGLRRLRARGYFIQPASSKAELDTMAELASPVKAFANERLAADPEAVTPKEDIWTAFKIYCSEASLPYGGGRAHFFKDLQTCGLSFEVTRPRGESGRVQAIQGLALLP